MKPASVIPSVDLSTPVLSPSLRSSIDQAVRELPREANGQLVAGVSLTGVEASVATKGPFGILVGGYAKRLWGGGFEAGAKLQRSW